MRWLLIIATWCSLLCCAHMYPILLNCTDDRWKTVGKKWTMGTTTKDSRVVSVSVPNMATVRQSRVCGSKMRAQVRLVRNGSPIDCHGTIFAGEVLKHDFVPPPDHRFIVEAEGCTVTHIINFKDFLSTVRICHPQERSGVPYTEIKCETPGRVHIRAGWGNAPVSPKNPDPKFWVSHVCTYKVSSSPPPPDDKPI